MSKEGDKMALQAAMWVHEDRIVRLHRCRLLLHGEGVLVDSENEKVHARIEDLLDRKIKDTDQMEAVVAP